MARKRLGKKYLISDIVEEYINSVDNKVTKEEVAPFIRGALEATAKVLSKCKAEDTLRVTNLGTWHVKTWIRDSIKLKHISTKQEFQKDSVTISRIFFVSSSKIKQIINDRAKEGK